MTIHLGKLKGQRLFRYGHYGVLSWDLDVAKLLTYDLLLRKTSPDSLAFVGIGSIMEFEKDVAVKVYSAGEYQESTLHDYRKEVQVQDSSTSPLIPSFVISLESPNFQSQPPAQVRSHYNSGDKGVCARQAMGFQATALIEPEGFSEKFGFSGMIYRSPLQY
ncbi:hypothetical protein COLO4_22827 [Corchorus olitorius]|uniref:Uncharacterized protein n=1 Tax=Corchorus olitorius TaxID=93759 RepID=A0A1R3IJL0_9ROSI|nr:hypothetical protein COLO4_22827 [Corchorus olitorius]